MSAEGRYLCGEGAVGLHGARWWVGLDIPGVGHLTGAPASKKNNNVLDYIHIIVLYWDNKNTLE